jgi:hypothetical protein
MYSIRRTARKLPQELTMEEIWKIICVTNNLKHRIILMTPTRRPDPTSVTPGSDSILAEPAPDSFPADRGDNSLFFRLSVDFTVCKSGERKSELFRQLTGKRLDSNNDLRGKKCRVCPAVAFPGARAGVGQRSVFAIWRRSVEANQAVDRFPYLKALQWQGERSWLA